MAQNLTDADFDFDRGIAVIRSPLARITVQNAALVAVSLCALIVLAGFGEARASALAPVLGPVAGLVCFLILLAAGHYARTHPTIYVDPSGIVYQRLFYRRFMLWGDIVEIAQGYQRLDLSLAVHLCSGKTTNMLLGTVAWRERDQLHFILRRLAHANRVQWSVQEPARSHDPPRP
ncbi:MAG: hypothetical protein KI785_08380 [Devosiaceae bacterium]|nr:hypothetical protein [Devosiaceae bacterium MH13]